MKSIIFFCMLLASNAALAQSKFFSTSSRGGVEGAKQNTILTVLQNEQQRMNACTSQGLIFGPTNPGADANGCLPKVTVGTASTTWGLRVEDGQVGGHTAIFGSNDPAATYVGMSNTIGGAWYLTARANGDFALHVPSDSDKLVVTRSGALRLFASTAACNASMGGALRYNGTTKKIELCNGTAWTAIGAGGGTVTHAVNSCAGPGNNGLASCTATCTSGSVVGGGCSIGMGSANIQNTYPSSATSWTCYANAYAGIGGAAFLNAYAVCLD